MNFMSNICNRCYWREIGTDGKHLNQWCHLIERKLPETPEEVDDFNCPIGGFTHLIEFGTGNDVYIDTLEIESYKVIPVGWRNKIVITTHNGQNYNGDLFSESSIILPEIINKIAIAKLAKLGIEMGPNREEEKIAIAKLAKLGINHPRCVGFDEEVEE